jgi:hypothetical protein
MLVTDDTLRANDISVPPSGFDAQQVAVCSIEIPEEATIALTWHRNHWRGQFVKLLVEARV